MKEALKMYHDAPYEDWLAYYLKAEVLSLCSMLPLFLVLIFLVR
jgi:hypothetical protein